eukprot:TRINITY_DN16838_c0_g1_i2.p1 TRINITY_DN16838_c0_g1~~TRINITY_DN16838_c0_g1_i2.p1  ORF type:complete len:147 (+),score=10.50 TRINITY_DN16838_c0_g1_i2:183-623(+)
MTCPLHQKLLWWESLLHVNRSIASSEGASNQGESDGGGEGSVLASRRSKNLNLLPRGFPWIISLLNFAISLEFLVKCVFRLPPSTTNHCTIQRHQNWRIHQSESYPNTSHKCGGICISHPSPTEIAQQVTNNNHNSLWIQIFSWSL